MSFLSLIQEAENSVVNSLNLTDNVSDREQWRASRIGCFTGSEMKKLMSTSRSGSHLSWGDPAKLVDFGEASIKYIFKVAKETKTGIQDPEINAKNFEYGKENEPALIQQILDDKLISDHQSCDFVKFLDFTGATPDGEVLFQNVKMALEAKSCMTWGGFYVRFGEEIDDKHNDFWQFQAEMCALNVRRLLYVSAYPGQTKEYEWSIIEISDIHVNAMIERCKIAKKIADRFNREGGYIKQHVAVECANYNPFEKDREYLVKLLIISLI